jgi:hypothetical protein
MTAVNYSTFQFDLAVARLEFPVLALGEPYDGITVMALPGGATASLKLGTNRDNIPLALGLSLALEDQDANPLPVNEGLFLTNAAAAGTLILLVSRGGLRS